jgi:hypothetical protein
VLQIIRTLQGQGVNWDGIRDFCAWAIPFLWGWQKWLEQYARLEVRLKRDSIVRFGWNFSARDKCLTTYAFVDIWIENKSGRSIRIDKVFFEKSWPRIAEGARAELHYASPKEVDSFKTVPAILEIHFSTKEEKPYLGKAHLKIQFEDSKRRKWPLKTKAIFTKLPAS